MIDGNWSTCNIQCRWKNGETLENTLSCETNRFEIAKANLFLPGRHLSVRSTVSCVRGHSCPSSYMCESRYKVSRDIQSAVLLSQHRVCLCTRVPSPANTARHIRIKRIVHSSSLATALRMTSERHPLQCHCSKGTRTRIHSSWAGEWEYIYEAQFFLGATQLFFHSWRNSAKK